MGWTNSHLHQFIIEEKYYSIPRDEDWQPVMDERKYRLAQFATAEGRKFVYEYDFGDAWEYLILVEKILSPDPDATYPLFIRTRNPTDTWMAEQMRERLFCLLTVRIEKVASTGRFHILPAQTNYCRIYLGMS